MNSKSRFGVFLSVAALWLVLPVAAQTKQESTLPHDLSELHGGESVESLHQPQFSKIELHPQEIDIELDVAPAELSPVASIVASMPQDSLKSIAVEVLERNPSIAATKARALAAAEVPAQVGSLPDPTIGITPYLQSPETRVGPQQAMTTLGQRIPWPGKLSLRAQAARYGADAAWKEVEARRLTILTDLRVLLYELRFLDEWAEVVRVDRSTLDHYETLARTRYAAGIGLEQSVIKIQAEITKDDNRLLDLAMRRATVVSKINALRDRPPFTPVEPVSMPEVRELDQVMTIWREAALAFRPELERADAEIAQAATRVELAQKEYRPDFNFGLSYTLVGSRNDAAGIAMPPEGNGDDVLALTAGINLPIWRDRLDAGVEEALRRRQAAEESKRSIIAGIDGMLGDLAQRIELTAKQVRLFEDVLVIQAEEALASAEAAYSAGSASALDLLDAERVLLEVRTSMIRAKTDYAIALARLEGVTARPLSSTAPEGDIES